MSVAGDCGVIEISVQENIRKDLDERIARGTNNGMRALALIAQGYAQQSVLRGPKTGRVYKRGKKLTHRASAPGEAPANDLGFLAQSIKIEITQQNTVSLRALAPYAIHLEYGSRKMAARPFLRPAGEMASRQAKDIYDAYISEALR
jgi:hypothetical protein